MFELVTYLRLSSRGVYRIGPLEAERPVLVVITMCLCLRFRLSVDQESPHPFASHPVQSVRTKVSVIVAAAVKHSTVRRETSHCHTAHAGLDPLVKFRYRPCQ